MEKIEIQSRNNETKEVYFSQFHDTMKREREKKGMMDEEVSRGAEMV